MSACIEAVVFSSVWLAAAAALVALLPFRADERYGLVVLDGSLLVGALLAIRLV